MIVTETFSKPNTHNNIVLCIVNSCVSWLLIQQVFCFAGKYFRKTSHADDVGLKGLQWDSAELYQVCTVTVCILTILRYLDNHKQRKTGL